MCNPYQTRTLVKEAETYKNKNYIFFPFSFSAIELVHFFIWVCARQWTRLKTLLN